MNPQSPQTVQMPVPSSSLTIWPLAVLLAAGCALAGPGAAPQSRDGQLGAVEVVQRDQGVFVYSYAETLDELDPFRDYESKRRITNANVVQELRQLITENQSWNPEYTKRCLPVWDYGVEFRDSPDSSTTYLFSFRCQTLKQVEAGLFRDFEPQAVRLYALLTYEVNDRTSESEN